jgi:hypothetical protein
MTPLLNPTAPFAADFGNAFSSCLGFQGCHLSESYTGGSLQPRAASTERRLWPIPIAQENQAIVKG